MSMSRIPAARRALESCLAAVILLSGATLAGCSSYSSPTTTTTGASATIAVVSGNGQTGTVGTSLASPLVVKVSDLYGNVVANAVVDWTTSAGSLAGTTQSTTSGTGVTQASLQLPAVAGTVTVTATLHGTTQKVTFTETAM